MREVVTVCIVDIDGTLADASHRMYLIQSDPPDWASFGAPELVLRDAAYPGAKDTLDSFRKLGMHLIFLTGRNVRGLSVTEEWLKTHMGRRNDRETLFMRTKEYEHLPASAYKEQQLEKVKAAFHKNEKYLFFEDDPFVARMYRGHGIVFKAPECWHVMSYGAGVAEEEPLWRY